jgi:hypothetical protein
MSALSREIGENPIGRVHLKRRLTAVLLADVVGYSRLMNADEEGTHLRLAECIETLIEPTVALHEGRLVRSKGDGFLVEFDSAVNAVNCAVDIQRTLAEADDVPHSDRKLELRIGINPAMSSSMKTIFMATASTSQLGSRRWRNPAGYLLPGRSENNCLDILVSLSRIEEIGGSRISTAQSGFIGSLISRRQHPELVRRSQKYAIVALPGECLD